MTAATFAAIAAFKMVLFSETFITFGCKIEIFAFDYFIFIILLVHSGKFKALKQMIVIVSRYLIPKGFRGITLFPFIIVSENDLKQNQIVINHEKIHIRQQMELLILPFFIWYGIEFLIKWIRYKDKNLAYRNISFEKEAYAKEKDLSYLKQRSFWKFLSYF